MEAAIAFIAPAIWEHAVQTFGSEDQALRWLQTPLPALQDRSPEQYLNSATAADHRRVDDILTKIDYGVF